MQMDTINITKKEKSTSIHRNLRKTDKIDCVTQKKKKVLCDIDGKLRWERKDNMSQENGPSGLKMGRN